MSKVLDETPETAEDVLEPIVINEDDLTLQEARSLYNQKEDQLATTQRLLDEARLEVSHLREIIETVEKNSRNNLDFAQRIMTALEDDSNKRLSIVITGIQSILNLAAFSSEYDRVVNEQRRKDEEEEEE